MPLPALRNRGNRDEGGFRGLGWGVVHGVDKPTEGPKMQSVVVKVENNAKCSAHTARAPRRVSLNTSAPVRGATPHAHFR